MARHSILPGLLLLVPFSLASGGDLRWSLDSIESSELTVHGTITHATGLTDRSTDKSAVFNGESLIKANNSEGLSYGEHGFTLTAWVNPYLLSGDQQMLAAKNRYSLDQREWGVMIDKDNQFRLYVWQDEWTTAACTTRPLPGKWHMIGVVVRPDRAELWVNGKIAERVELANQIAPTEAPLTIGGIDDNGRIRQNFIGAIDEVRLFDKPLSAERMATAYQPVTVMHDIAALATIPAMTPIKLWTGPPIPKNAESIPWAPGIEHRTIHRASQDGDKFLHGAAIVEHKGVLFANWANSPTNENGPHETLRGRRSSDGGLTWSDMEVIGPGFDGPMRHSHGVLFVHKNELWAICSRFGEGKPGRRFPGLQAEAFVLNEQTNRWDSRGIVMENCWPYDEPVRMANGSFITGGQDKDGLPVVAISQGDDLTQWESVLIPFDRRLKPSFAETTVWAEGQQVTAVIRGGGGVAWMSTSSDHGRTWSIASPSNLPMPRAKAYLGKLSTGQLYLLSNLVDRDTLVVSVSRPDQQTLSRMWRVRHGKSIPPRFPGRAKGKQWSYPYGFEHDGKLFVVYSIGKEDCGLSVIPVASLQH